LEKDIQSIWVNIFIFVRDATFSEERRTTLNSEMYWRNKTRINFFMALEAKKLLPVLSE